jgi:hypothetical protein
MYRLLAFICAIGLGGMTAGPGPAQAECRLSVRFCTNPCPVQPSATAMSCRQSCSRYIVCDVDPERSATSRVPKSNLPQGALPQGQLPTSRMPTSAFN